MTALPLFVIRPAGVWNSRTPLHDFLRQSHQIVRDYSASTLAVHRTTNDIDHPANGEPTSLRKFARSRHGGVTAGNAFSRYLRSWRALKAQYDARPGLKDFRGDVLVSLYAMREYAIARYSAVFEIFVQCWALNMLLARLETQAGLIGDENKLAIWLSPFRSRPTLPTVPQILRTFPSLDTGLAQLPHVNTDIRTGKEVEAPVNELLNAKSVILFWRDFRNAIIHRGSLVTHSFCADHADIFEALRAPYGAALRPLEPGARLQLPDVMFVAMSTTHLKAAIWLNTHLQELSTTRGRLSVSSGPDPSRFDGTRSSEMLLKEGDHPQSFRWLVDSSWRDELLQEFIPPNHWSKR